MNLRKLFGLPPKDEFGTENKDLLHIWEDDYLMIELYPKENLNLIINETKRISEFGQTNFDGIGFKDVTAIGEIQIKTNSKKIPIEIADEIFRNSKLKKLEKVAMQGVGTLEGEKVPLGYGNNNFAIFLEEKSGILEHIWCIGRPKKNEDSEALQDSINKFAKKFDFIGVNWFKTQYYCFDEEQDIAAFIKSF